MGAAMSQAPAQERWVRQMTPAPADYRPANQPGLPSAWWRLNWRYTLYMLRELSSVFNALWAVRLLMRLNQLRRGPEAYEAAVAAERRPLQMTFNVITLLF